MLLSGVSLALNRGERVACVGPSGAGKTSLLRVLCGLDDSATGTIYLDGKTPSQWGWPAFRRRVCLVGQRPVLFEGTVAENLRRPFDYHSGCESVFPAARAAELMDALLLGRDCLEQHARVLSVGQQQRLCLIRALLLAPDVLLLDEPTSALDLYATQAVEATLSAECQTRGLCLFVVTHNERQASDWCERQIDVRAFLASPAHSFAETRA